MNAAKATLASGPAKMMSSRCHAGRSEKANGASSVVDSGVGILAEQPHVAAEREQADRVLGPVPRGAQERPAEAEGELEHAHAEQPRHQRGARARAR